MRPALCLVLLVLVGACQRRAGCAGRCGTAVIVVNADADALLPPVTVNPTATQVSDLIFLKLADLGLGLNTVGDAGFVPRLAKHWKWDDSLTLVFTLDERARWQDGKAVDASDVAFTFDVYR